MAIESIAKTLGTGSGIDITALVGQLVDAQFANKNALFTKRDDALKSQISAAAELKSGITGFDTALKSLIKTGALATAPVSGNTSILKVSQIAGSTVAGLPTAVEVRQLAAAQVASGNAVPDKSAAIGTGKLTLSFGTATVANGAMTAFTAGAAAAIDITIDSAHSSLQGVADAINAKGAGVTASILSDSGGARLVIRSATGASQAFTLTATEDPGAAGLAALNIGIGATGTSVGTAAQDAVVAVDGIAIRRPSNAISDLVAGVRIDLVAAAVGTKVTIGTQAPTDTLGQTVSDVVDSFNELLTKLKTATDPISGPLKSDPAAKALLRSLQSLTTKELVSGAAAGTPTTLAGIGVATNRDGSLRVDSAQLAGALVSFGSTIEAMFQSGGGLSLALGSIATAASNRDYGLGASESRYSKAQAALATDRDKATAAAETLRTRMTRQFAGMDSAVAAYKSTQTFIENQVAAWNSKD
jgi:flagellar hook-associated protein 2